MKLRQGNIFTSICHSVHRLGGMPGGGHAWLAHTPPRPQQILRDTVNERAVRILLECILVFKVHSHGEAAAMVSLPH